MGLLKDVLDTFKAIDISGSADEFFRKRKYSSISKRSTEGTLQFPVLVSKSMDIDTLQIVTKALERQYSSFTQIVLTMSPVLNLDKEKDATGYLKNFHQNTDVRTDHRDIINSGVDILDNYNCFVSEEGHKIMYTITCEGTSGTALLHNKEHLESVLDYVITETLNNKSIPRNAIYKFSDENISTYHNQIVTEESNKKRVSRVIGSNNKININNYGSKDNSGQQSGGFKEKIAEKILVDNDVKKSNELVPTTLHIRLMLVDKDKKSLGYQDFILGVKTIMHPVSSDEMVTNLINGCKNNNKFFDFIKWTTGETSFFKDFLFNIKEIKDDVVNRSKGASPWWITLKRRKALSKIKDALMLPNQILPNATIVVSSQEIEFIKTQYGFDLMNTRFIDKIMKTYFLLGFVVVDNSTQIAHFLFDGQQNYQSVTFNALERENSAKVDTKEILKLMNKI